jgi:hypothetical protein
LLAARRAPEPEALVVRAAMNTKLASPNGTACYAQRKTTIEPIFGTSK